MAAPDFIRESFPVGPLQCNCTILGDPLTGEALVVDPGDDAEKIVARLKALKLRPVGRVHTHAHFDHVGCARPVSEPTLAMHGTTWTQQHGGSISVATMSRTLRRLGITLKKSPARQGTGPAAAGGGVVDGCPL